MIALDAGQFDERVVRGKATSLVEFWAPWCVYCRLLKPKLDRIGRIYGDTLLIGRVDASIAGPFVRSLGVEYLPGLAFYDGGALRRVWYGDVDIRELSDELAGLFPIPGGRPR